MDAVRKAPRPVLRGRVADRVSSNTDVRATFGEGGRSGSRHRAKVLRAESARGNPTSAPAGPASRCGYRVCLRLALSGRGPHIPATPARLEAGALRLDAASTKNEDGRAWATAYIRIRAGLFRVEPVAGSDKIGKVPIMLRTTSDGRQSGTLRQGGSAARPRGLHVWDRDSGDRPRPRRVPGAWHRRERGGHRPGAPRRGVVRGVGDVRRRRRAVASRPGCPAPSTLSSRATMPFPTS